MGKNVMIPLSLLERLIELLDGLDSSRYGFNFHREYEDIQWSLKVKMQRFELREAYTRFVGAKDEDTRHFARIEYLRQKDNLGNVGHEPIF
jgi:hypothetical protein